MFGCCVAGRLMQTDLKQVDATHAYFELPAAGTINHLMVFLLGTIPFPDGYGASVHFYWPGKGFQLLGMLSNEKPSAIFRLRGTYNPTSTFAPTPTLGSPAPPPPGAPPNDVAAVLGLAIEPLPQILAQLSTLPSQVAKPSSAGAGAVGAGAAQDPTKLAERIVKHLFNYVSGFAGAGGAGAGGGGRGGVSPETAVPMNVIVKWYESFMAKVKAGGTGFLEREE
ncbi:putative DUF775-domain-containing protein [Lyophyllum shimeji]|uniref:DUF775-domain-containing protein n=1 Tax=Lyophyllum shimeji TaxID=47721 RepID=A0A9P3PP19_LYOSH|nr:putative DUF775-domain-containing protein [Lyophyllum shimeji]